MKETQDIIMDIPKGLLMWYDFKENSKVLYIGKETDIYVELLKEKKLLVQAVSIEDTMITEWIKKNNDSFNYIIAIKSLEKVENPDKYLSEWNQVLKTDGCMLLGMNNRFGLRYFCGDRDPYTERNFDGIEEYKRTYSTKKDSFLGRCYNQSELKDMLGNSGWTCSNFYSVLPDLEQPQLIYASDFLPNEELASRYFPMYNYPDTVFLDERTMYTSLAENGMFHTMANAYLIECSKIEIEEKIKHVTISLDRGREHAVFTIIKDDETVEKKAAYSEGEKRLEKLIENGTNLQKNGIKVVEAKFEDGSIRMPYIKAVSAQLYLEKLFMHDEKMLIREMDRFRDIILSSSEIVEEDKNDGFGATLKTGYLDLVPLNAFYIDGDYVFYDQEFCQDYYPANVIIYRMLGIFYYGKQELQRILPINFFLERYNLLKELPRWKKLEQDFLVNLLRTRELRIYHEKYRSNVGIIHENRQRVNYSNEEYQRLFVDIFKNVDDKKLVVFGSGVFAQKFLALYCQDYPAHMVVDNNQDNWGKEIEGIEVQSPELLYQMKNSEYKVIICIKNYLSVMKQLDNMGITEYSIFDSNKSYQRKRRQIVTLQENKANTNEKEIPKKYQKGYIAGVFDLFHVGHLNMFKHAKKQCDYLIVGVVSDEGVRRHKEVEPVIPFEERIEMVRSCRYVDEAVEIPLNYGGTRDAFRLYHFDCQFSGSDYVDNPDWLADKAFLEKNGAEMVFFPYTEGTSSTKIKSLINKRI